MEKRSIGWFRVDIEALPEFSYEGPDAAADQLVMNNDTKMSRLLHV